MSIPLLDGAVCASIDPEFWFPDGARRQEHRKQMEQARKICLYQCPLELVCLERAMAAEVGKSKDERHGVYGGKTPEERAALEGKRLAEARAQRFRTAA